MRVKLPLSARVVCFCLDHRLVRVGGALVCRQLTEQQDIFGTAYSHFASVLALFCPAEAVGLIVLPYNVGGNNDPAHVTEPVLYEVHDRHIAEGIHGRHSVARSVTEKNSVLDVNTGESARL